VGTAVHGWKAIEGDPWLGTVEKRGWAAVHVVWQKEVEGQWQDQYDQHVLVEDPGAIIVATRGNRVALVQNFRATAPRPASAGKGYVRRLDKEGRWDELVASLGEWTWELPRGMAPPDSAEDGSCDFATYAVKTAKMEALAEAGLEIVNARVCGPDNPNTTFFPHAQAVVAGEIVSKGEAAPEAFEVIGETILVTKEELLGMVAAGQIRDGMLLGALVLSGFWFK
jgi:hypothetical protein